MFGVYCLYLLMFKLLTHRDDFNKKKVLFTFLNYPFFLFLLRPLVGLSVVVHIPQFEKLCHMLFCECILACVQDTGRVLRNIAF